MNMAQRQNDILGVSNDLVVGEAPIICTWPLVQSAPTSHVHHYRAAGAILEDCVHFRLIGAIQDLYNTRDVKMATDVL